MAKRIITNVANTWAPTAVTVAATTFSALKGANATQVVDILEVLISGMHTSSAAAAMMLAYTTTLGATPVTPPAVPGSDGPMMINATALASTVVAYNTATTGPFPASTNTLPKLNLSLNLFGGIIRWNAAPTQQWTQVGNATSSGETVLWNSSTGGGSSGLANTHIIYEPY
jgi:hypothetical protein